MKVSGIALVSFIASGAIAGGNGDSYKSKNVVYDPPACKRITRDVADGLAERDEIEERGYGYPPPVTNKKCPENKVTCSKFDVINKGGYKGSASATVDCKKGNDYTVTATIGPCKTGSKGPSKWYKRGNKGGDDTCLIVEYKGDKWPKDSQVSYIGVYDKKLNLPKKLTDLKDSGYCNGNTCIIPLNKLPGASDLCGDDLYIAYDAGRCKRDDGPGYNPKGGKKYDDKYDDHKGGKKYDGKKYDDDHKGGKKYDDDHKGGKKYDDDRKGGKKYDNDDHKGGKKYDNDHKGGNKYDDDRKGGKKYDDKHDDKKGPKYDNDKKGPSYDNDKKGPKYDNDKKGPNYDDKKGPNYDDKKGPNYDDKKGPNYDDKKGPNYDDKKGPNYDDKKGPNYDDKKAPNYDDKKGPIDNKKGPIDTVKKGPLDTTKKVVDLKVLPRGGQKDFKKDEIAFLKIRVQCEQKKVCKSYCCKV